MKRLALAAALSMIAAAPVVAQELYQDLSAAPQSAPTTPQAPAPATTPTTDSVSARIHVSGALIAMGDYTALAVTIVNRNAHSAVTFDQADAVLLDASKNVSQTDPWHPLLLAQARSQLYDHESGKYYSSFHTVGNTVFAGNTDHYVGMYKAGKYVRARITLTYYQPGAADPIVVIKEIPVTTIRMR